MAQCLITKLKGIVNDDSLPKLGELIIEVNNVSSKNLELTYTGVNIRTCGNITISNTAYDTAKSVSGTGKIFLSNEGKENQVYEIKTWGEEGFSFPNLNSSFLKACSILYISNKGYDTPLARSKNRINISNTNVIGEYADFKDSEIISLSNSTWNGGEVFDLDKLPNNSKTTLIELSKMNVKGDISRLNATNYPKVTSLKFWGNKNAEGLHGDISKLTPNGSLVYLTRSSAGYSWSDRPSNYKVLAMSNANLNGDIDKMLINQASLEVGSSYEYKNIGVIGTRTSASDAAVATLQDKGFTIIVTPA